MKYNKEHAESRCQNDTIVCNDCENEILTGKYCEDCAKNRQICICGNGIITNETDIILSENGNIYLNCTCSNCEQNYLLISPVLSIEKKQNKLLINNENAMTYIEFVLYFNLQNIALKEEIEQLAVAKSLVIDILRTKYMDLFHEKFPKSDSLIIKENTETVLTWGNFEDDFKEQINKKLFMLMFESEIMELPIFVDLNVKKYISL